MRAKIADQSNVKILFKEKKAIYYDVTKWNKEIDIQKLGRWVLVGIASIILWVIIARAFSHIYV